MRHRRSAGAALASTLLWIGAMLFVPGAIVALAKLVAARESALDGNRTAVWLAAMTGEPDPSVSTPSVTESRRAGEATTVVSRSPASLPMRTFVADDVGSVSSLSTRLVVTPDPRLPGRLPVCADGRPGEVCVVEQGAVLQLDAAAMNDELTRQRVERAVPSRRLRPAGLMLSTLSHLPFLGDLEPLDRSFGHIDLESLPTYVEEDVRVLP